MSASIGSNNGYDIYTGFWVDWTYGKINGSTLTLTRQSGGLLIAFLALFVSATGKSFWRIACFFFHRYFASKEPQDGLYHQRQAIIRNAETPEGVITYLLNAGRVWRKRARRPIWRLLPVLLFALVTSLAFAVAGLFSSKVTTNTANEVLLRGKACGILPEFLPDAAASYSSLEDAYYSQRVTAYLNYALQCYPSNQTSDTETCQPFVKPKIDYSISRNASCPFEDEMCILKSDNLILDTGFLDSHKDFGVNVPQNGRFLYRQIEHCAPVTTKGFSSLHNNSDVQIQAMRYYYGNSTFPSNASKINHSFTYEVPVNFSSARLDNWTNWQSPGADYSLGRVYSYGPTDEGTIFNPIPQLSRTDADLRLFFLSAPGVVYPQAIDDPWYSAHVVQSKSINRITGQETSTFVQDDPARVLGCVAQYQFCNPNLPESSRCEPLGSNDQTSSSRDATIWRTREEQDMIAWAKRVICKSKTSISMGGFDTAGISALSSRYTLSRGLHSNVASNQWQLDLDYVFQASLASYQAIFVETVTGPSNKDLKQWTQKPNNTASRRMCNNQKIVSSRYYSFNVLGLAIILVLGGLIMIIEFTLESIVTYIEEHRRDRKRTYATLEWKTNTTLQLQRLAHAELGIANWSHTTGSIPTTQPGQLLGVLDMSDEKNPHLSRPTDQNEAFRKELTSAGSVDGNEKAHTHHMEETPPKSSGSRSQNNEDIAPGPSRSSTLVEQPPDFEKGEPRSHVQPPTRTVLQHQKERRD